MLCQTMYNAMPKQQSAYLCNRKQGNDLLCKTPTAVNVVLTVLAEGISDSMYDTAAAGLHC